MDDIKKMLRSIIYGQSALKQELLAKIGKLDKKVDSVEERLVGEIQTNRKRIDKLGKNLAYLDDDAPTIEGSMNW